MPPNHKLLLFKIVSYFNVYFETLFKALFIFFKYNFLFINSYRNKNPKSKIEPTININHQFKIVPSIKAEPIHIAWSHLNISIIKSPYIVNTQIPIGNHFQFSKLGSNHFNWHITIVNSSSIEWCNIPEMVGRYINDISWPKKSG